MLCLRQEISGNPARITVFAENNRFSWAGRQIDRTIAAHKLLGAVTYLLPGPKIFSTRGPTQSVGECGNGLSATMRAMRLIPRMAAPKKRGVRRGNDFNLGTPATMAGTTVMIRWRRERIVPRNGSSRWIRSGARLG